MINLNRPTCDDAAIVRQSRIVAFDANARAEKRKAPAAPKKPARIGHDGLKWPETFDAQCWAEALHERFPSVPIEDAIGWMANAIMRGFDTANQRAKATAEPADAVSPRPADPPMGTLAQLAATDSAVSGAALVGTKPQPDADGWIPFECTMGSVCPVPVGVEFEVRFGNGNILPNIREPISWRLLSDGVPCSGDAVAYRILPAKPATIAGWRRGPDVPESERKSGLWFMRFVGGYDSDATPAWQLLFKDIDTLYRPAPPGVKEGDAYSPALYGEEA